MAGNMGKWPSGHGQLTKIKLSDGCEGKTITWRRNLCKIAMDLKAIWEMSGECFQTLGVSLGESFVCVCALGGRSSIADRYCLAVQGGLPILRAGRKS